MLSNFARAYQAELLRSNQQIADTRRSMQTTNARTIPTSNFNLLTLLGNLLISLGERLKGQSPCPELTHGQA